MILCVFLAIGESWEDFVAKGQDELLLKQNFTVYAKNFDKVYVFSYGRYGKTLLPNVLVLPNKWVLHRFVYAFLIPILYRKEIMSASVIRGLQITGGIPALIAKLLYRKHIVMNYGYDYSQVARLEGKLLRSWLYKLIELYIVRAVDAVIVTTEELKKKVNLFRHTGLYLIPNGVDTQKFKFKKKEKTIQILHVGRLEKQKNLVLLIRAVSLLSELSPQVTFIGAGSQKELLLKKAHKLHIKLNILEPVSHTKLVDYYNQALVFVLPSLIEGHPKALLEAMSCQVTVIGTNVEGIKSVINHKINGWLVKLREDDLARGLRTLLTNEKLRKKLGMAARKSILENYDLRKTSQEEVQLLKDLSN